MDKRFVHLGNTIIEVRGMGIVTLIENQISDREDLYNEHGLSIYIEVDGKNVLFDTGQSGNFIDNAKKLNIDLKELDCVIISHGHYDHSGGFERLIKEVNPNIKLYIGEGFFDKKYNLNQDGDYEFMGNSFNEEFLKENNIEVEYINKDRVKITDNLSIFTNFIRNKEFENTNQNMYLKKNDEYEKDKFLDEISIGVETSKGLSIVVGCAHVGIVNILDTIIQRTYKDICTLIGGTHLVKEDDEKINKIIEYIKDQDIETIAACHCTGKQGETMFSQQLEEGFITNNTGDSIKIE